MFAMLAALVSGATPNQDKNCQNWSEIGECEKNPGYMLVNCAESCERAAQQAINDSKELQNIHSFFDLSAKDIHGNLIEFAQFKGQVTLIVNVASYCGYTDSHYRGLVELWSQVKHTGNINILAFPCNQFGSQEPDSNEDIDRFALGYGVEFAMMDKIDVNGANTNIVYRFLKYKAGGPANIAWNFATYFVVSPDGSIESHSGVEPLQLKEVAMGLVDSDEL